MISVALCTYNGEQYIREQLDSILTQSISVDEVVICDDCSRDSTCVIINAYALRYPQIRLIKNETNVGFRKNFEKALIECKGDYIFFSDQDDIWDENKVEMSVAFLKKSGMYGVYSDGRLIDQNGNRLNETLFSRLKLIPYIEQHLLDKYEFEITCLNGNHVTGATLAITKSAKDLILPFRTSKYLLHDMWIATVLFSYDKLGRIDKPLISYRLHVGQGCGLNMDNNNDILIGCFEGNGRCSNLIELRARSIAPIYFFKLNRKDRKRIFKLYKDLYVDCVGIKNIVIELCRFLFMEMIVFVKTRCGFGFQ